MCLDENYYDEKFLDNSEVYRLMEELKNTFYVSMKNEVANDVEMYKKKCDKLQNKLNDTEKELNEYKEKSKSITYNNKMLDMIKQQFEKQCNIDKIITENEFVLNLINTLFTKTFDEYFSGEENFYWWLYVSYYNDRKEVFSILDNLGIIYHKKICDVILPHEWDETYIDKFLDNLDDNYVSNSHFFKKNLQYWSYFQAIDPFNYSSYSDIPWQFVLRNNLWNSKKYIKRIVEEINKRTSNSCRFFELFKFQEIDIELKKYFFSNIILSNKNEIDHVDIVKIILNNNYICYIDDKYRDITFNAYDSTTILFDKIFSYILSCNYDTYNELIYSLPIEYQIKFSNYLDENNIFDFLQKSKVSKELKKEILLNFVGKLNKEYNDILDDNDDDDNSDNIDYYNECYDYYSEYPWL